MTSALLLSARKTTSAIPVINCPPKGGRKDKSLPKSKISDLRGTRSPPDLRAEKE
jgi:hypothetical protein